MNSVKRLVRDYPLAVVLFLVVWYLSFFTPPQTGLEYVRFIDKWTHLVMYGGTCSVMWLERILRHRRTRFTTRALLMGWLAPATMSGIIELLQEYCTGGRRSGDWLDLLANVVGVTLALGVAWMVARHRSRR